MKLNGWKDQTGAAGQRPPDVPFGTNDPNLMETCMAVKNKKQAVFCICVLIYAAAMLFRLTAFLFNPLLARDSALYLTMAELWHETGDYTQTFLPGIVVPPFPGWAVKTAMQFGFGAEVSGRTIAVILGSLLPVAGFLFTWKITRNIRIGLLAALLLIIHPELVSYSFQPLRENFYLLFEALLLITLVDAIRRNGIVNWSACGCLLSLAFFCRYEALEFLVVIPSLLVILLLCKRINLKQAFLNVSAFYLLFVLTAIPLLWLVDFNCYFLMGKFGQLFVKLGFSV